MDYQTKNEIQNQVKKMFSQFKADEKNKKIMEKIIGDYTKLPTRNTMRHFLGDMKSSRLLWPKELWILKGDKGGFRG